VKISLHGYNDFASSKEYENIVFKIKKELIMKSRYKLFLWYCLTMLVIIIGQECTDHYFRDEVREYTLGWIAVAFVWIILGGLTLTFIEGRIRQTKSNK